jgi:site-specific recombinase XerD
LKYQFNQSDKENLSEFLNKLREKNQTSQQQKQASDAISLYYETETQQPEKYFQTDKIIKALSYPYDLIVKLLYGCGLRISECKGLRVVLPKS